MLLCVMFAKFVKIETVGSSHLVISVQNLGAFAASIYPISSGFIINQLSSLLFIHLAM